MPAASSQPRTTRRRARRITIALVVCAGAIGATAYGLLSSHLPYKSVDVFEALGDDRPSAAPDSTGRTPLNILLIGSDTRSGDNDAYDAPSDEQIAGARSDTTMLVHLSADRRSATVVSIPRDTLAPRPSCPLRDGRWTPAARQAPINTALGVGGVTCVVTTVEKLTDLRIDHVVQVDFAGFAKLVDAIGGIEVTLSEPIDDPYSGLHLPAGIHLLNGEQALAFNRTRHGVGDGSDLARIGLQHQFLTALWHKLDAEQLLSDPIQLQRILRTAGSAFTVDTGLSSLDVILDLGTRWHDLSEQEVTFLTMPHSTSSADPNRLVPAQPEADQLWHLLRTDHPTTALDGPG
ncbi:LCP family protein [Saccharopolyspora sp. WRP15-2]|uniref:LCP family protein n=1 Tax=Saccharopolyspora oryzae TaxID=2997343 RepID=A0ABT4UWW4_9PSEU|nr:LCP family protein [Saccharopolyspora oryzae]MDA3626189.1 LCP family protein [Saccharopolyspora oryzae]